MGGFGRIIGMVRVAFKKFVDDENIGRISVEMQRQLEWHNETMGSLLGGYRETLRNRFGLEV